MMHADPRGPSLGPGGGGGGRGEDAPLLSLRGHGQHGIPYGEPWSPGIHPHQPGYQEV